MKTIRTWLGAAQWWSLLALAGTALLAATPTVAQIGYTEGGDTGLVTSGYTECIHTGSWEKADAIVPCEPDTDGDGVPDLLDECPDTPAGWAVDSKGCPLDSDGDGVPDGRDKCPNTPQGVQVDADGCPLDSDGDGVPDYLDKCPNTPQGVQVDSDGCPLDPDGDGVLSVMDACPDTPPGVRVGSRGCELKSEIFVPNAFFDFDKAEIRGANTKGLDIAAEQIAAEGTKVRGIEMVGHTDSVGSAEYNDRLSLRRAEAVRQFFVDRGVDADLIDVKGMGENQPLADNATEEGRARNRRVEVFVAFE